MPLGSRHPTDLRKTAVTDGIRSTPGLRAEVGAWSSRGRPAGTLVMPTLCRPRRAASWRKSTTRPRLEILEDRSVPSTFTVRNLDDSGPDSLRQVILDA